MASRGERRPCWQRLGVGAGVDGRNLDLGSRHVGVLFTGRLTAAIDPARARTTAMTMAKRDVRFDEELENMI